MAIRVLFVGLGPIGNAVVKQVARRPGFDIVAAVDIDPAKAGLDLGHVAGLRRNLGVTVADSVAEALRRARRKPDVAVLCTSSSLKAVLPQVEEKEALPWRT